MIDIMNERYCVNCGALIGNDNYCSNCGVMTLKTRQNIQKSRYHEDIRGFKKERTYINTKKSGMSTGKLVVLILVLFIMGSAVITFAIFAFSSITYNQEKVVFANSVDELLAKYDYNNDGLISYNEYEDMHFDATFGKGSKDIALSNFALLDKDKDGYLNRAELSQALNSLAGLNDAYEANVKKSNGKS